MRLLKIGVALEVAVVFGVVGEQFVQPRKVAKGVPRRRETAMVVGVALSTGVDQFDRDRPHIFMRIHVGQRLYQRFLFYAVLPLFFLGKK